MILINLFFFTILFNKFIKSEFLTTEKSLSFPDPKFNNSFLAGLMSPGSVAGPDFH